MMLSGFLQGLVATFEGLAAVLKQQHVPPKQQQAAAVLAQPTSPLVACSLLDMCLAVMGDWPETEEGHTFVQ
jgi:hypothetical protein